MTYKQVQWSSQHDWHIEGWKAKQYDAQGYAVKVRDYDMQGNLIHRIFMCYDSLRAWAGY